MKSHFINLLAEALKSLRADESFFSAGLVSYVEQKGNISVALDFFNDKNGISANTQWSDSIERIKDISTFKSGSKPIMFFQIRAVKHTGLSSEPHLILIKSIHEKIGLSLLEVTLIMEESRETGFFVNYPDKQITFPYIESLYLETLESFLQSESLKKRIHRTEEPEDLLFHRFVSMYQSGEMSDKGFYKNFDVTKLIRQH